MEFPSLTKIGQGLQFRRIYGVPLSPDEASQLTFSVFKGTLQIDGPSPILKKLTRDLGQLGAKAEAKSPYGPFDNTR